MGTVRMDYGFQTTYGETITPVGCTSNHYFPSNNDTNTKYWSSSGNDASAGTKSAPYLTPSKCFANAFTGAFFQACCLDSSTYEIPDYFDMGSLLGGVGQPANIFSDRNQTPTIKIHRGAIDGTYGAKLTSGVQGSLAGYMCVAKTGSDGNAGTQALPKLTIAGADTACSAGQMICILDNGTYSEAINLVHAGGITSYYGSIPTITYAGAANMIIQGSGILFNSLNINGLGGARYGFRVNSSCTITNCTILNCASGGMWLVGSTSLFTITNCLISNIGMGSATFSIYGILCQSVDGANTLNVTNTKIFNVININAGDSCGLAVAGIAQLDTSIISTTIDTIQGTAPAAIYSIFVSRSATSTLTVISCRLLNTASGISFFDTSGIINCNIYNNFINTSYIGIYLDTSTSTVNISRNEIFWLGTYVAGSMGIYYDCIHPTSILNNNLIYGKYLYLLRCDSQSTINNTIVLCDLSIPSVIGMYFPVGNCIINNCIIHAFIGTPSGQYGIYANTNNLTVSNTINTLGLGGNAVANPYTNYFTIDPKFVGISNSDPNLIILAYDSPARGFNAGKGIGINIGIFEGISNNISYNLYNFNITADADNKIFSGITNYYQTFTFQNLTITNCRDGIQLGSLNNLLYCYMHNNGNGCYVNAGSGNSIIQNNIFYNNIECGCQNGTSGSNFINNNFIGNGYGFMALFPTLSTLVQNNISWRNILYDFYGYDTLTYCLFQNLYPDPILSTLLNPVYTNIIGAGCLQVNPQFISELYNFENFHLQTIDGGYPIDSVCKNLGSGSIDIGAYAVSRATPSSSNSSITFGVNPAQIKEDIQAIFLSEHDMADGSYNSDAIVYKKIYTLIWSQETDLIRSDKLAIEAIFKDEQQIIFYPDSDITGTSIICKVVKTSDISSQQILFDPTQSNSQIPFSTQLVLREN